MQTLAELKARHRVVSEQIRHLEAERNALEEEISKRDGNIRALQSMSPDEIDAALIAARQPK